MSEQARNGQQQATEGLRSLARELQEMADGGERQGPASDLAVQAADKLGELAEWFSRREPSDLTEEVRGLARRRPGAFLLGAAAAGVLAGRLTRGAVDANRDTGGPDFHQIGTRFDSAPPRVSSPPMPVGPPPGHLTPAEPAPRYPAPATPTPLYQPPATPSQGSYEPGGQR